MTGYAYPRICVSPEEAELYRSALGDPFTSGYHMYTMPDGMPTAQKWNYLAEEALKAVSDNLFMLASDDMIFATPNWDTALLDHYNALENKIHVYALQDSRDENGTPHIIATREYIEAIGYFVPPIFLHWFVDSWTVDIARSVGCFTHLKDYLLIHDKGNDKGQPDATHTGIRSMGWAERDKWVADKMNHVLMQEKIRLLAQMNYSEEIGSPLLDKILQDHGGRLVQVS